MKRLIAAGLALALASCAGIPSAPSGAGSPPIAGATKLDEQAGLAITLAYQAANRLALLVIRSGHVRGADAEKLKALDAEAFRWVSRVRIAYQAGNAVSYQAAIAQAYAIVAEISAIAK